MEKYLAESTYHMYFPCRRKGLNYYENWMYKYLDKERSDFLDDICRQHDCHYFFMARLCNGNLISIAEDHNRWSDGSTVKLYGFVGNHLLQIVAPDFLSARAIYALCHKYGVIFKDEANFCSYTRDRHGNIAASLNMSKLLEYFTLAEFNTAYLRQIR